MVLRWLLNNRLRDYFDVWALSRQFDFEGPLLSRAVAETFARRQAEVPAASPSLTDEFAADPAKMAHWRGVLRRSRPEAVPQDRHVVLAVAVFLGPLARDLHGTCTRVERSRAGGGPRGRGRRTEPRRESGARFDHGRGVGSHFSVRTRGGEKPWRDGSSEASRRGRRNLCPGRELRRRAATDPLPQVPASRGN